MRQMRYSYLAVSLAPLFFSAAAGQNLFVLPSGSGTLPVYNGSTLAQIAVASTIADPVRVVSNNLGTRVWVLGRTGNVAVLNAADRYTEITRYFLGSSITNAAITPDGRRLVILAGQVRVLDLSTDIPGGIPAVDAGNIPSDLVISPDSTRAFVMSAVSRTVTAIDLTTTPPTVIATQSFVGNMGGIGISPNGLLYVTTTNRLFELDTRTGLTFVQQSGFAFEGEPGRPAFSPNGNKVVMFNRSLTGAPVIISVDVRDRNVSTSAGLAGVSLGNILVASDTTAFALGNNGRLYSFGIDPAGVPGVTGLGLPDNIAAAALSNEALAANSLYVTLPAELYRFNLTSVGSNGPIALPSIAGGLEFTGAPSTNPVATLRSTTTGLRLAPGAVSYPVVFRAIDSAGRPVFDAQVTFTAGSTGGTVSPALVRTNRDGFAVTRIALPSTPAVYTVRAATSNGVVADSSVTVAAEAGGGTAGVSVAGGNGQIVTSGFPNRVPLQVLVRDSLGAPAAEVDVDWVIKSAVTGVQLVSARTRTDTNGLASNNFTTTAFTATADQIFRTVSFSASVSSGLISGSADLFGIVLAAGSPDPAAPVTTSLGGSSGEFVLPAGGVLPDAFRSAINSRLQGFNPVPLPNVGLRASAAASGLDVACRDNPVSNASGIATCTLVVGSRLGSGVMSLFVGEVENLTQTYRIRVVPGAPSRIVQIQGDGQVGTPGTTTPRALVVQVQDSAGNPLSGVSVTWTILSGDGTLTGVVGQTDISGRASALVRFGNSPGAISVRAATEGLATSFTLQNEVPIGTLSIDGGNNQSAPINTNFATRLSVRVTNPAGQPFPGVSVAFAATSGPVSLTAASAVTDAQGIASVSAVAGAAPGQAVVTASVANQEVRFTLTVTPQGPRVDGLFNPVTLVTGASPCSLGLVSGTNFLASDGAASPTALAGPLPVALAGLTVRLGGIQAPIFSVTTSQGRSEARIQVPCELRPGSVALEVSALGQSTSVNVTLSEFSPGIIETTAPGGTRYATAQRPNGTFVSPANPALHGEAITGLFIGLGPAAQATGTNAAGIGQPLPAERVIIGLGNAGMAVTSAVYAPNLIGLYMVTFTVDPSVGSGAALPFAVAVRLPDGSLLFGQPSTIPVRAQ